MKGSEANLLELMDGGKKYFVIPVYQRKYDWKQENCRQLYEDLKKIFGNRLQDMSHHYAEHKDLNDYLCHRNQAKQTEKKSQVQSARRMPQPQPKKKRGFRL